MSDTTDNAGWTGAPPGMLQDDSAGMSKWLASKPDAMKHAREAAAAIMSDTDKAAPPARAPECVIVCQQSVDCGAWPDGACERKCGQAERAQAEPVARIRIGDSALGTRASFFHLTDAGRALPHGPHDLYTAPPAAQAGDELPQTVLKAARALLDALDFSCGPHLVWDAERDALRAALAARGAQAGDEPRSLYVARSAIEMALTNTPERVHVPYAYPQKQAETDVEVIFRRANG